jgi:prepilin-type N-terminal cleavage/methylation domain-containing protein
MRPRAFTLIEVLIAIALMLALSAGIFSYISGLLSKRDRLVEATSQQATAATLFEELENDLATTFAADATGAPGVQGEGAWVVVRCRAVGARSGTGAVSDLGDIQGGEMRFASGALSARRYGKAPGNLETVATGIERLRFRYFNGTEWLDSFDSAATGDLPVAIEAALWFGTAPSDDNAESIEHLRAPDRIRVMVVPDGPVTGAKGAA